MFHSQNAKVRHIYSTNAYYIYTLNLKNCDQKLSTYQTYVLLIPFNVIACYSLVFKLVNKSKFYSSTEIRITCGKSWCSHAVFSKQLLYKRFYSQQESNKGDCLQLQIFQWAWKQLPSLAQKLTRTPQIVTYVVVWKGMGHKNGHRL